MHENRSPTLCLDGPAVRRIREEKKLTQLYVAKVVGVTTDTISRWENNRYPTVKRENVLKLAEALEVPLDEVLRKAEPSSDEESSPDPVPSAAKPSRSFVLGASALALVVLLLFGGYWLMHDRAAPDAEVFARRVVPNYAAPGSLVPVRIRLDVAGEARGLIVRESFPPGWTLVEADPVASSYDGAEGTVRWILRPAETGRTISYLVRVSPEAQLGETAPFSGDVVVHPDGRGTRFPVGGGRRLEVAPRIWADTDGDGVVDDAEMLEASETFDEMEGISLDWSLLETLWDAGRYRWDPQTQEFHPVYRD